MNQIIVIQQVGIIQINLIKYQLLNKISKLKFNDINNLINGIKGNKISEADTKKKINELNEIKKVETNGKRLIENKKVTKLV